ncbi:MAG: alpha/beta hydrolase fold domain-containing protein [Actinobacteria bacterium]|nr:alpha/beta hydrolase fold domain-containing protein [Actinomycetota bacterium]
MAGTVSEQNARWMSLVAGKAVVPQPRETMADLIASRGSLSASPDERLPDGVVVETGVVIRGSSGLPLSAEICRPAGDELFPVVVHFHGGGYCAGSAASERRVTAALAGHGFVVVAPDYALAPENPFPAALEDAVLTVRWTAANAHRYGGDPGCILLEGGSAGAGLAASAMLVLSGAEHVDEDGMSDVEVSCAGLALLYGLFSFPLLLLEAGSNAGTAELWTQAYLGPQFSTRLWDPRASPLESRDLGRFPPVYLSCGSLDSMLPQTLRLAERLSLSDVETTVSVIPDVDHAFAKYLHPGPTEAAELHRIHTWMAARSPGHPGIAQPFGPSKDAS